MQIAIDGPASSGKSTVAKWLAKTLKLVYVDTGAMYRAVTLHFINHKVNLQENDQVKEFLHQCQISFKNMDSGQIILLNGQDITKEIRSNEVNNLVSEVSALEIVRSYLVSQQQEIAQAHSVIMDGRDIGTVVLPQADFKFYLTASPHVRAKRRYLENLEKGLSNLSLEEIEQSIIQRDYIDSNRKHSPLVKAEDAIELDCSDLSIEETISTILKIIKKNQDEASTMNELNDL